MKKFLHYVCLVLITCTLIFSCTPSVTPEQNNSSNQTNSSSTPDSEKQPENPNTNPDPENTDPEEPETEPASYNPDSNDADPHKITAINKKEFTPAQTSVEMAKAMTIGWNLGNTLDANGGSGLSSETSWGAPETTKEMIEGIASAGFKTIRIPVSWHTHVSGENNTINSEWLARVKTIVDWAYNSGLCIILNIHHDNMNETDFSSSNCKGYALTPDTNLQNKSKKYISDVWSQVADCFKDYDNRLVFEILNEPRDIDGKIWGNEWWVNEDNATAANAIITSYEQAGLNAIRNAGSNNSTRFVMVPDYAASPDFLGQYTMPQDTARDRMILSVHAYTPYEFTMYDTSDPSKFTSTFTQTEKNSISYVLSNLENNYIKKGIGVVIGETGASNKKNLDDRIKWAQYYFSEANKTGIPLVLWDNCQYDAAPAESERFGFYDRNRQLWYFPSLMKAMLNGAGVKIKIEKIN